MVDTKDLKEIHKKLMQLLARLAAEGWMPGVELSYWDRGGPPGPGFESNLLQFLGDERGPYLRYTKTRFDKSAPPYRVEVFELMTPGKPSPVLSAITEKELFSQSFEEETPLPIGGATKITFTIESALGRLEKTFYEKVPQSLKPVEDELRTLMETCERDGAAVDPNSARK